MGKRTIQNKSCYTLFDLKLTLPCDSPPFFHKSFSEVCKIVVYSNMLRKIDKIHNFSPKKLIVTD